MSDLISTAGTVIQLVTRLREINKNIANAEFSNALADLSLEVANLKIQVAALLEENDQLKRRVAQANNSPVTYKGFAYFDAGGDGPFCSGCYDASKKLIRLTRLPSTFRDLASHQCPGCKQTFNEA